MERLCPVSAALHRHYDPFATILIAPSLYNSKRIANALAHDNTRRKEAIESGKPDPGRSETTDWFEVSPPPLFERILIGTAKDTDDEYELIILRHSHFLIRGCPMLVRHPTTGRVTLFCASEDGFLHKEYPTGPRLPPFSSRGPVERSAPLNPILVNFSAHSRLGHTERQIPGWRKGLNPEADLILQWVSHLHDAVNWESGLPIGPNPFRLRPP